VKNKFLQGALILTIAGLMVKVIGSVNRILLSRLLGGEGIGLYQIAYPIYLLIIAISAAGVPTAISIMVAKLVAQKDYKGARRIFKVSAVLMLLAGSFFAVLLYYAATWLISAGVIRDPRAYYALLALIPAVFFATLLASFRGYFQGYQNMTPPAVSQILEQLVRVTVMLALAYYLLPRGLEYAAAGAAFGAVPGSITGIAVLGYFYYRHKEMWHLPVDACNSEKSASIGSIAFNLLELAIPVSCANLMLPVVTGLDMLIVPERLEAAGFTVKEATTAFGYLAGMALPLVTMSTIPTTSIAAAIVPAISEAKALDNRKEINSKCALGLRLGTIITLPAALGIWALAWPVSQLLYGTTKAAPVIAQMSPSIFFFGIQQVTTGILQGMGFTYLPMVNMLISAAVKCFGLWHLTAMPQYNIVGAAWASDLNFFVGAFLNVICLAVFGKCVLPFKTLSKIIISGIIMTGIVLLANGKMVAIGLGNTLSTLLSVVLGAAVYLVCLGLMHELDDIKEFLRKKKGSHK
jgi:stage V sporulation protein B